MAPSLSAQVPGHVSYHRWNVHMAFAMCGNGSFRYTLHMPCVSRPRLIAQEIVRARTILLARLRSGHWWVEGGTCYYHHTRALQAPPPRARNNHLGWNDSWDSLFSLNHASFPTVSFCAAKLVQRCSERDSRLYHLHSFASPSRVWCQYLFAFSKATRARELKSSGAKAAECSSSCSTEETGEAYTCGGIPGVLFTVTQLTPQLCTRGSYNIHTVFSVVVYTFLPGNASQDLFHKPCWNVHGTSFSIFRPEISGNLS